MVATQGNPRLLEFALRECKNRQAELDLLFVRHIAVMPMGNEAQGSPAGDTWNGVALAIFVPAAAL